MVAELLYGEQLRGIGAQTTMPFGSPAEVQRRLKELRALAATGARIIIAPTHVIEPDAAVENVPALYEAFMSVE